MMWMFNSFENSFFFLHFDFYMAIKKMKTKTGCDVANRNLHTGSCPPPPPGYKQPHVICLFHPLALGGILVYFYTTS